MCLSIKSSTSTARRVQLSNNKHTWDSISKYKEWLNTFLNLLNGFQMKWGFSESRLQCFSESRLNVEPLLDERGAFTLKKSISIRSEHFVMWKCTSWESATSSVRCFCSPESMPERKYCKPRKAAWQNNKTTTFYSEFALNNNHYRHENI